MLLDYAGCAAKGASSGLCRNASAKGLRREGFGYVGCAAKELLRKGFGTMPGDLNNPGGIAKFGDSNGHGSGNPCGLSAVSMLPAGPAIKIGI